MESFDDHVLLKIAKRIPPHELFNLCGSSKRFNELICQNDEFWKRLLIEKFPTANLEEHADTIWRVEYFKKMKVIPDVLFYGDGSELESNMNVSIQEIPGTLIHYSPRGFNFLADWPLYYKYRTLEKTLPVLPAGGGWRGSGMAFYLLAPNRTKYTYRKFANRIYVGYLDSQQYKVINLPLTYDQTRYNADISSNELGIISTYNPSEMFWINHHTMESTIIPIPNEIDEVYNISVGNGFIILLDQSNRIWGYGRNDQGQLGLGDTIDRTEFTHIITFPRHDSGVIMTTSCENSTIAVTLSGTPYIFGSNVGSMSGYSDSEYDNFIVPQQMDTMYDFLPVSEEMGNISPNGVYLFPFDNAITFSEFKKLSDEGLIKSYDIVYTDNRPSMQHTGITNLLMEVVTTTELKYVLKVGFNPKTNKYRPPL